MRFHQLNTYAIAARATELVELELGRPLRWGFEGSRLLVVPHAGILENAFYSAESHSLQFYSFMGNGRRRRAYHTALAHDIVAHETGHAILDAVRPRYYEPFEPETSALHEAVGDLCAVFAALSHEVIQRRVAGSLDRLNLLSEIAEGFEEAGAHGWGSIRSLVDATPSDWKDTIEPHDLSLKLSSTIYLALRKVHQTLMRRGESRLSALDTARTVIQRMAVRALDFLPPADCTIAEYAEALLAADRSVHPTDDSGYRAIVHGVLARRGLVSKREVGSRRVPLARVPAQLAATLGARRLSVPDANRHRLALAPHADQRDFVVRDVQLKRLPTSPGEVAQIAIVYEYPTRREARAQRGGGFRRAVDHASRRRHARLRRTRCPASRGAQACHQGTSGRGEALSSSKEPRSSPSSASRSTTRSGGRPRDVPGSRSSTVGGSRSGRIWPHAAGDRGGHGNEHHAARL